VSNVTIEGAGLGTILDFVGVSSGKALSFGYDIPNGGCQNIAIRNLSVTDSSSSSSCDTLITFAGGPAGQSPPQTSAFMELSSINLIKFNNPSGTAIEIDGISHVYCENVFQYYNWGCGEGLLLSNTANVNTGVDTFNNCTFRGQIRGMRVNATGTLMDSVSFNSCFFANHENAAALEAILLEGTQVISNFVFQGCHLESRHATQDAAVLVTGLLFGCIFEGCHLSCGNSTDQNLYGFKFDGATVGACSFTSNEFLRLASGASGGRCLYFKANCSMDSQEPNIISTLWRNITSAFFVEIEAGSSDENFKAVHCKGDPLAAGLTVGLEREYVLEDTATPSVKNASRFLDTGTTSITDFSDGYTGQIINIIRPDGTAGTRTLTYNVSELISKSGSDIVMSQRDTVQLRRSDGGIWYEI